MTLSHAGRARPARHGTAIRLAAVAGTVAVVLISVLAMRSHDVVDTGDGKDGREALVGGAVGQEWNENGLEMVFCWCPPGRFTMGSPQGEWARSANENPVEMKLTRGFWVGKFEVTQSQWQRVLGKNPSDFSATGFFKAEVAEMKTNDFPVEQVSWHDAVEFCRQLTQLERRAGRLPSDWEYRLPSEAQWEYACRAGTKTATAFGGKLSSHAANFDGGLPYNGAAIGPNLQRTARVGSYRANAWGIYDMHGNVWEWCRDGYASRLVGGTDREIPQGNNRVTRGGAWNFTGWLCRSANRGRAPADYRYDHLGFRIAAMRVSK